MRMWKDYPVTDFRRVIVKYLISQAESKCTEMTAGEHNWTENQILLGLKPLHLLPPFPGLGLFSSQQSHLVRCSSLWSEAAGRVRQGHGICTQYWHQGMWLCMQAARQDESALLNPIIHGCWQRNSGENTLVYWRKNIPQKTGVWD